LRAKGEFSAALDDGRMALGRAARYGRGMTPTCRALRLIAPAALLVAATSALAAPAKPAAQPAVPSSKVIPLPLNPIVPATERVCGAAKASGLGAMQLKPAEGAKPANADYVLVNYIGYLAENGEVFDQNMQSAFPVEGVIPGFSEGLQMMTKGSIWRFCVPSALGYGAQESGPIPANSDLVFQVELVDFKTVAEVEAMRAAQADATSAASEAAAEAAEAAAKAAAAATPQ
jgi:FKBP-type peptidyl-prolyl cis-trans isomerase FkpA